MANNSSNTQNGSESYGLRPFSARSIVLSVLLGGARPSLPVSAVMAVADLFAVPPGTMRTALSRMVTSGELLNADGTYELGGRHLERRRIQSEGRVDPPDRWAGDWLLVTVNTSSRSVAERRAFRSELTNSRLGELRPDTWLRPDNLGSTLADRLSALDNTIVMQGALADADPNGLAAQLWPLDELAADGRRLLDLLLDSREALDSGDHAVLPGAFTISAAVVRYLATEPQLPPLLVPEDWPAHELRGAYNAYESAFQRLLRSFLTAER